MKIVIAHLLINIVILVIDVFVPLNSPWMNCLGWGVFLAQTSLLCSWIWFSEQLVWAKVPLFALGVFSLSWLMEVHDNETLLVTFDDLPRWLILFAIVTVLSLIPRLFLFRLIEPSDATHSPAAFQFSTRSLLLITTFVAIVMASRPLLKTVQEHPLEEEFFVAIYSWSGTLLLLWAGLGGKAVTLRLIASVILATAWGSTITLPMYSTWTLHDCINAATVFGSLAIVVSITLLAVRREGYRLLLIDSWLTRMFTASPSTP